ncbi:MAG TPA: hypothetical protein VG406_19580 [Isosphaeraceae bacterium]|jgi:5-methylcytosine-specific restriction protein A|nr:hypothetical protein [Isosphaeraceae bacterium]
MANVDHTTGIDDDPHRFEAGRRYRRRELHERFGGQRQGGISTPAEHPLIFLFSSPSGEAYGYRDGWASDGTYVYTGEGQRGDMALTRGNSAILHHEQHGKDLHLFEAAGKGFVEYVGEMTCVGHERRRGPDLDGHLREILMFKLLPKQGNTPSVVGSEQSAPVSGQLESSSGVAP